MPLYEYRCDNGHEFTRFLKLADYREPQTCECGAASTKLISKPMINPSFQEYESPIDGRPITSKQKRIEDLARSNCVPYEEGMVEENNKRLAEQERRLEKSIDETVEAEIEKMPPRKRELLEQEFKGGADIEVCRQ